jgi:NAD(P)-dependent dehydrogenase (short-subunit alcohol dehydrogenase family)
MNAALADLFSLEGEVALVTGGGGALGSLIAKTLAAAGARVVLAGRTAESLQRSAEQVRSAGGQASCVIMDVTREESITEGLASIERDAATPTIVVNNAGTNLPKPALKTSAADWDLVHDTNLRGCFLVARECAQRLRGRQLSGSIVNVASVLAVRGSEDHVGLHGGQGRIVAPHTCVGLGMGAVRHSGERDTARLLRIGVNH